MAVEQVEPLACGRDAAEVWEHAAAGTLDEHERSCPYCGSARAGHDQLGAPAARMAAEPLRPPPSVLERVTGAAVAGLRPHELLEIGPDAWLGRPAAAAALRHVVDSVDGLRARHCRIEQQGPAGPVRVGLTVAARVGVDLRSVTARARRMVVTAGVGTLGVPVAGVDIHVEDVWEEPTEPTAPAGPAGGPEPAP